MDETEGSGDGEQDRRIDERMSRGVADWSDG